MVEKTPIELYQGNSAEVIRCYSLKLAIVSVRPYISSISRAIITHPMFDAITLLIILANCITLSMDDPTTDVQEPWQITADYTFQALYTAELVLKSFGMGFLFNSGAYLRDPWNILDFIIVVFGYFGYLNISEGIDLKALRSFRVLRPLRTITTIEGLRILMAALFSSLPLLGDTLIILGFFFMIFAITGLQMWNGILTKRCLTIATGEVDPNTLCGAHSCPNGAICVEYLGNPNFGGTNFDNIFSAFLTVFQSVTLEGWTDNMRYIAYAWGDFTVAYFALLTVLGSYFLLNFTLAVIKSRVSKTYEENRKILLQKKNQRAELQKEKDKPLSLAWCIAGLKLKMAAKKLKNYHVEVIAAKENADDNQDNIKINYYKQLGFPTNLEDEIEQTPKNQDLEEKKEIKIISTEPLKSEKEAVVGSTNDKKNSSNKFQDQKFIKAPSTIRNNFMKALKKTYSENHQKKQKIAIPDIDEFTNILFTSMEPLCPQDFPPAIFIEDEKNKEKNESLESILEFNESGSPRMSNFVEGRKPTQILESGESFYYKKSPRASLTPLFDDSLPLHAPFQTMSSQKLLFQKKKNNVEEKKEENIVKFNNSPNTKELNLQNEDGLSKPAIRESKPQANKEEIDSTETRDKLQPGNGDQKDLTISVPAKHKSDKVLQKIEVKKADDEKNSRRSSNADQPPPSPNTEINPDVVKEIRKEKLILKDTTVEMTSADDVLQQKKNENNKNRTKINNAIADSTSQTKKSLDESYAIFSAFPNRPPYKIKVEYKVTVETQNIYADIEDEDGGKPKKKKVSREEVDGIHSQMPEDSQSMSITLRSRRDERSSSQNKSKKIRGKQKKKKKINAKPGETLQSQSNSLYSKSAVPQNRNSMNNARDSDSISSAKPEQHPLESKRSIVSLNNVGTDNGGSQIGNALFI